MATFCEPIADTQFVGRLRVDNRARLEQAIGSLDLVEPGRSRSPLEADLAIGSAPS